MDEESAAAAAGKVRLLFLLVALCMLRIALQADALRVKVGYPLSPNTEDPRSLANYYGSVKINNDTFFENMLSAE